MISSTTPNYHEFHNSVDFNKHYRKRPFDQNVFDIKQTADNTYKKFKTTPPSVNSLSSRQTTKSAKTSFATPSRSFHMGVNYSPLYDLTRFDSKHYENDVEPNLFLDTPRIIDLSTGDSLESIIPSVEKLQISRRLKRPIELTENQNEVSNILGIIEENKGDLIDESPLHSLKRIRTSKEHMCNFIEEEEEIDPRIHKPIDIMKEIKIGYNNTLSSNKANSIVSPEEPENPQSLSLYIYEKNPSNIKFTVPYQKAIARYMRSQFQHLNNNEEYGNKGKELILYRPINDESKDSFIDSNVKIFEIPEETMDLEDQNDAFSCINDSRNVEEVVDQMDID